MQSVLLKFLSSPGPVKRQERITDPEATKPPYWLCLSLRLWEPRAAMVRKRPAVTLTLWECLQGLHFFSLHVKKIRERIQREILDFGGNFAPDWQGKKEMVYDCQLWISSSCWFLIWKNPHYTFICHSGEEVHGEEKNIETERR